MNYIFVNPTGKNKNGFYTNIYMITIKIFTCSKQKFEKIYMPF